MDDNYFISGSIDGKVRIWAISDCHVVDWISIKDIVTAVCYRPDGQVIFSSKQFQFCRNIDKIENDLKMKIFFIQGGIIGSLAGNCRFYNVSGIFFFTYILIFYFPWLNQLGVIW